MPSLNTFQLPIVVYFGLLNLALMVVYSGQSRLRTGLFPSSFNLNARFSVVHWDVNGTDLRCDGGKKKNGWSRNAQSGDFATNTGLGLSLDSFCLSM
jgi:hypothetical protein